MTPSQAKERTTAAGRHLTEFERAKHTQPVSYTHLTLPTKA